MLRRLLTALSACSLGPAPLLACPPEYSPPQPADDAPVARVTPPMHVRLAAAQDRGEAPAAYIGVLLAPVPPALAAHVGAPGLMVVNIVTGSPADSGGLQQYDVLRSIAGEPVDDMGDVLAAVERAGVDAKLELEVIRGAKAQRVTLTTAPRATGEVEYKYEADELAMDVPPTLRGHRLRVGPGGRMYLDSLGALDQMPLAELFGQLGNNPGFWQPGGASTWSSGSASQEVNGQKLKVTWDSDGKITVEREDAGGNTTKTVYDSPERLKQSDAEAFKLYRGHGGAGQFRWSAPQGQALPQMRREWQDAIEEYLRSVRSQRESVQQQWSALEEQLRDMPEVREQMEQLRTRMNEASDQLQRAREMLEQAREADPQAAGALGRPTGDDAFSAVELDGGRIRITIRKDQGSVVREFKSEQDLQQRAPELYERYRELSR